MSLHEEKFRRIACQIMLDERLDSFTKAFHKTELLEALNHSLDFVKANLSKSKIYRVNSNTVNPEGEESACVAEWRSINQAIVRLKVMPDYKVSEHDIDVLAQNWFWEYSSTRSIHRDATKVRPFLDTIEEIKKDLEKYTRVPVLASEKHGIYSVWAYDVVYSFEELQNKLPDQYDNSKLKLWQWLAGVIILGNESGPNYAKPCCPGKTFVEYDGDRAVVVDGKLTNWFNLNGIEKEVAPERTEIV